MCDHCVVEQVKQRMISRRDILKAAPLAVTTAAIGIGTAPQSLAQGVRKIVDMTYTIDEAFPTWTGSPGIKTDHIANFKDNGFNVFILDVHEHTGTHVDAPLHFSADGHSVDQIPVESLACPLCVIDIREKASASTEAEVTPDDIKAWIAEYGDIPEGACVAMNSGWQAHVKTPKFRGADDDGVQHYPGFNVEAAKMLMEETSAAAIGVDTLSLDIGATKTFDTHYAWLPTNRYGIENLANLDQVPESGATLMVGAPKHRGGSGGPARIVALV